MSTANDLSRMVPGFEFLQTLMKGASNSLPGVQGFGQWVAPTLDPEEIDKRIQELKTVQFWLEQNARLLGATVQALEVQRMTLSTLQTMNLPLADLRDALQARPSAPPPSPPPAPAPRAASSWARAPAAEAPADEDDDEAAEDDTPASGAAPAKPAPAAAPAAIDPMQWWGALTQQFTEIATKAVKDSAEAAAAPAKAPAKAPVSPAAKAVAKAAGKTLHAPAPAGKAAKARPAARAPARKRTP